MLALLIASVPQESRNRYKWRNRVSGDNLGNVAKFMVETGFLVPLQWVRNPGDNLGNVAKFMVETRFLVPLQEDAGDLTLLSTTPRLLEAKLL